MPKLVFTYQQNKAGSGEEEIITTDTEPEMDFGNNLNVEPDTMSIISKHSHMDVRTLMDKMETVRTKQKRHSTRKLNSNTPLMSFLKLSIISSMVFRRPDYDVLTSLRKTINIFLLFFRQA